MVNPLLTRPKPKKAPPASAKAAKAAVALRPAPKSADPAPARRPATTRQQAQRRRITRLRRRFEATFAALPKPLRILPAGWAWPQLLGSRWNASKWLSLALASVVVAVLVQIHTHTGWFVYRENVQINNLTYLDAQDLYQAAGVDGWNIFWLQPESVRQRLLALPYVADATVSVDLPNQVAITIREQQPIALWITEAAERWVMPSGAALPVGDQRGEPLLQIIDPQGDAQTLQQTSPAIDLPVLQSALILIEKFPALTQLRFNHDYGLNFNLPGGSAWVYWGDGEKMETKFANLMAVQKLIAAGKENPQLIDVRFDRPYIR